MYEPHFGLRARPFASAPDPDFYFESRGHHRALAYLRHGVAEGDSFIVMTGEIGAGKTTLIQKLLRELDTAALEARLLVSSQLDARELLAAAVAAFGGAGGATSLEALRARLLASLEALTAGGRRALLVIDEAQNLRPDAVELLVELAARQAEGTLELQVLLVGQPELQQLIQRSSAPNQRQTVFLHCHIGCLSEQETRDYIDHRLRHVGWAGSPDFLAEAYQRIHALTDGVPRRVNRLCDRLLLSAYLGDEKTIAAPLVDRVDGELRTELGDNLRSAPQERHAPVVPAMAARTADHAVAAVTAPPASPRSGPQPGRPIPTLSAFVTPQWTGAAAPAVASVPPEASAPAPLKADLPGSPTPPPPQPHPPSRAPVKAAVLAALLCGLAAVVGAGWWLNQRASQPSPQVAPQQAPPAAVPEQQAPRAPLATSESAPPTPSPSAAGEASCTAAVIALGLCTPAISPPSSKE